MIDLFVPFRFESHSEAHYVLTKDFFDWCGALRAALHRRWRGAKREGYFVHDLGGACADAGLLIRDHLRDRGGVADLVEGTFRDFQHCWTQASVRARCFIIDITATQFGPFLPPVLIIEERKVARYYKGKIILNPEADILMALNRRRRRAVRDCAYRLRDGGP